ncbi:helix-turn-helix domain-containing protein [Mucilaginibacter sp. OK098]|uniref:helix-turn-helix domain-containing protein n=1 Tax=Mucilaginibacter sp. OK098 TaxID=1855297 RepID=UPI000922BE77|nr:helix-turn-helix domain-containing protein [Mucilaginibacter sp. OK098]SHN21044.1 AraC-type DNA-binding protein [Mucilaginibacter sp. OK098]
MKNLENASVAQVFISCKKEKHYSREVILPQPALVRVLSGEVRIASADRVFNFFAGDTVLLPRNQLGRLSKLPLNGEPCVVVSILFHPEKLRQHYADRQIASSQQHAPELMVWEDHPLLESLFNSLLPYFKLADALPADIAAFKIEEAIRVLRTINQNADQLLGQFEEPGKLDLVDFMEKNYMFNLSLEKFGYLTGRSLTTYKKDFKKAFKSTPGKWLTQKRLELAHYQIFEKKRKPSDVYFDVGFENLSHFSFAFKKQFGYNPTSLLTC